MQEVANIMGANDLKTWYANLYKWVVMNPRQADTASENGSRNIVWGLMRYKIDDMSRREDRIPHGYAVA